MEGGQILHAFEMLHGRSIYRAPSADFIPYPYMPFYPWVVAQLTRIFGLSEQLGRCVSVASLLVLAGLTYLSVWRLPDHARLRERSGDGRIGSAP